MAVQSLTVKAKRSGGQKYLANYLAITGGLLKFNYTGPGMASQGALG